MNIYNLIAYLFYIPVIFYITVFVGKALYKAGSVFLVNSFHGNSTVADTCNRFLITGYYLVNLGYAALSINFWNDIHTLIQLIEELSFRIGFIIGGLSCMHYFNLFFFSRFSKTIESLYKN